MPLQQCSSNGHRGWRWGKRGKCYTGSGAKRKALKQGMAIEPSKFNINRLTLNRLANPLRLDPTHTTTLRRQFEQEVSGILAKLKGLIIQLVVTEDAFGLKGYRSPLIVHTRWAFHTSQQKLVAFQGWLRAQTDAGLLGGMTAANAEDGYWRRYVEEGYRKGAGRAFDDVRKAGLKEWEGREGDFYAGTKDEFLRSSFARPVAIEKVKLLAGRTFTDLQGVTGAMSTQMSRVLTDGLARGANPLTIARELNKTVDNIGRNRARAIARTEVIRAHAEGQLDTFERLKVDKIGVMAEWSTAEDDLVCPLCESLNGVVMTVGEARGLIPRHVNCRCAYIPANVGEPTTEQIRSKEQVEEAIKKSIRAEMPKTIKRTYAEQKARTGWAGADRTIGKVRPKGIGPVSKGGRYTVPSRPSTTIPVLEGAPLTDAEQKAVNYYTSLPGGVSTNYMQRLLAGTELPKTDIERTFVRHFRSAVSKMPSKDTTAWRGIAVRDLSAFDEGKTISGQIIESWTTDQAVAKGYSVTYQAAMDPNIPGRGKPQRVVLQLRSKFKDPNKVVLNPSGKEVWRLDSGGYRVVKSEREFHEGVGWFQRVTVEPMKTPRTLPSFSEEVKKGLTKEERSQMLRASDARNPLNKKIKAGTATTAEVAEAERLSKIINDFRVLAKQRVQTGGVVETTVKKAAKKKIAVKAVPKPPPKKVKLPKKTPAVPKRVTRDLVLEYIPETGEGVDQWKIATKIADRMNAPSYDVSAKVIAQLKEMQEQGRIFRDSAGRYTATLQRKASQITRANLKKLSAQPDGISEVDKAIRNASKPAGKILEDGMTTAENMRSVVIDGTEFYWSKETEQAAFRVIREQLASLGTNKEIPETLWQATERVIFTAQRNKMDDYWAVRYNSPSFKSAATGGDGTTMVYNAEAASQGTFAHESGHNFASQRWQSTDPRKGSLYQKAQRVEPPVSSYGANSPSEDFAEACKQYVTSRNQLRFESPKKFEALKEMLEGQAKTSAAKKISGKAARKAASPSLPAPSKTIPASSRLADPKNQSMMGEYDYILRKKMPNKIKEKRLKGIEGKLALRGVRRKSGRWVDTSTGTEAPDSSNLVKVKTKAIKTDYAKAQAKWEASLTKEEREGIEYWSQDVYTVKATRDVHAGREVAAEIRAKVEAFDRAIENAPKFEGTVYRGQSLSEVGELKVGESFDFGHVVSTSKKFDVGEEFATYSVNDPVIFEIHTKSGTDISRIVLEEYRDQAEVFLSRKRYQVIRKEYVKDSSFDTGGYHRVVLE